MMTYDEFNAFCGTLPATTHVIQWGGAHVWKVGGKVFAIGGWSKVYQNPSLGVQAQVNEQPAFTFKASELNFQVLSDQPGFRPAPYMASRGLKWIQQYETPPESIDALHYYIRESHRMVSQGLTKKLQKALGLNQH